MLAKSYYDLLELPPTSSAEEVKKAFRAQIARYHPDKVQHLGKEFQAMAAERAAELTEAYRILSDAGRRAEYDRTLGTTPTGPAASAPPSAPPSAPQAEPPPSDTGQPSSGGSGRRPSESPTGGAFTQERATRDEWFLKAAVARFRQALTLVGADYDSSQVRGFDLACVPKSKLFGKKGPRLLGRFVTRVDGAAVADAWAQAGKWSAPSSDEICVFLMGTSLAPARELADAIAEQRKKSRSKVTLIPVDARDWNAHMPTDAPTVAKNLLTRLRSGT